jgi:5-methylcytosine-specific restriction protein A
MMGMRPPVHRAAHQHGKAHRLALWKRFATARDKRRGKTKARGYGKDWQELRAWHLAKEPNCRTCALDGRIRQAKMVDHIESIAEHPELRLDPANLQSLCWPCHNAKTNRVDGGFGRPRS